MGVFFSSSTNSGTQGHGIITLIDEATPSRTERSAPTFESCDMRGVVDVDDDDAIARLPAEAFGVGRVGGVGGGRDRAQGGDGDERKGTHHGVFSSRSVRG